jgi:hypothetical protein
LGDVCAAFCDQLKKTIRLALQLHEVLVAGRVVAPEEAVEFSCAFDR